MVYLLERMASGAQGTGTVTFLAPGGGGEVVGWSELYADATRLAGALQAHGVGPGRSVVVLALTSRAAVTGAMATWLAGGALTMAPTPARTMDEAGYVAETGRRIDRLGDDPLVLVGSPFEQVVPGLTAGGRRVRLLSDLVAAARAEGAPPLAWVPPPLSDEDPAILQLTSGTTASARTVRISHANLAANVEGIRARVEHDRYHGRLLSWLPLSHDMGLIGTLVTPMTCGRCDVLLYSPLAYLARPASWMRLAAEHRVTATAGPNSAYALAARLLETSPPLDLSALHGALSGGENIDPDVMAAFATAAARHGFDPGGVMSAYGMAEAVVAITMTQPRRGLAVDVVDADQLARHRRAIPATAAEGPARVRRLVRLGRPVDGMRVRVVDPDSGEGLADRHVGEIQVTGTSLSAGYHNDIEATAASRTADGWLRTGDLGYLADGELVVTGRAKDVIILAGRNIYPDEVERAAARADGVRPGNAVAFSYQRRGPLGSEGLAVAVETRADNHGVIRKSVTDQVQAALGLTPHAVVVLPPGSLPKTPSGKLQRAEARRLFAPADTARPASCPAPRPEEPGR
jgi:fatty-acyl-CoA synthase